MPERRYGYRNDRLIAVPLDLKSNEVMEPRIEFNSRLKDSIAEFLIKYNETARKEISSSGLLGRRECQRRNPARNRYCTGEARRQAG